MFPLGKTFATPGALRALEEACMDGRTLFARHRRGDWGSTAPEDIGLNEEALRTGGRLMSVYPLLTGQTVWIITEADRSATTLLLPTDY